MLEQLVEDEARVSGRRAVGQLAVDLVDMPSPLIAVALGDFLMQPGKEIWETEPEQGGDLARRAFKTDDGAPVANRLRDENPIIPDNWRGIAGLGQRCFPPNILVCAPSDRQPFFRTNPGAVRSSPFRPILRIDL